MMENLRFQESDHMDRGVGTQECAANAEGRFLASESDAAWCQAGWSSPGATWRNKLSWSRKEPLTTMVPPSCHLNEFVFAQLSFNLLPFYGALRANRLKVLMTKWTNTQVFSVAWVLLIICGYWGEESTHLWQNDLSFLMILGRILRDPLIREQGAGHSDARRFLPELDVLSSNEFSSCTLRDFPHLPEQLPTLGT